MVDKICEFCKTTICLKEGCSYKQDDTSKIFPVSTLLKNPLKGVKGMLHLVPVPVLMRLNSLFHRLWSRRRERVKAKRASIDLFVSLVLLCVWWTKHGVSRDMLTANKRLYGVKQHFRRRKLWMLRGTGGTPEPNEDGKKKEKVRAKCQ